MYLLALVDVFGQQGVFHLQGSVPENPEAKRLLNASGFPEIIAQRKVTESPDPEVMTIKTGERGETAIAKMVADFSLEKIAAKDEGAHLGTRKAIYEILLECMGNTYQHAYQSYLRYDPKWWIMADHNASEATVNITILDYGEGIPSTVRKRFLEGIGRQLTRRTLGRDNQLILSALRGERRSRTRKDHHGKGLPQIYEHSKERLISGLTIVSGHAHVSLGKEEYRDTQRPFQGTLISFQVVAAKDAPEG